jgi:ABC-2 type transport system ATP-binding protein
LESAIHIDDLTKTYQKDFWVKPALALDRLALEIHAGEVFAFLGPNGAGKTTTIKLITRLLFPTSGKITIFGIPNTNASVMNRVGFMPEQPNLYGYLKAYEFLDFIGHMFRMPSDTRKKRIGETLAKVGLAGHASDTIRHFSRGMIQRLGLAQAMINDPDLYILDEPMSSLDPIGRKEMRDLILELKSKGKTIFFSSHILSDAEIIADRVGILDRGRLVQVGSLKELIKESVDSVDVTFIIDPEKLKVLGIPKDSLIRQDDTWTVRLDRQKNLSDLFRKIQEKEGQILSVIPQKRSLEDIFMAKIRS